MTSQGSPYGRFQKTLRSGNVLLATAAARELGQLSLGDALALVLLMAAKHDERYKRAAMRWHARFELEVPALTIEESQLALAALCALERTYKDGTASALLRSLCQRHGLASPRVEVF